MPIHVEQMGDVTPGRKTSTEPQNRKQFVAVIVFNDLANALDRQLILIRGPASVRDVVQGVGVVGVAVGGREVDGDGAGELGAAPDVVEEAVGLAHFDVNQVDLAAVFVALLGRLRR